MTEQVAGVRAYVTLNAPSGLSSGATSLSVNESAAAAGYPTSGNFRVAFQNSATDPTNYEVMLVTATGGTGNKDWTVTRAYEAATRYPAATHAGGSFGACILTGPALIQLINDRLSFAPNDYPYLGFGTNGTLSAEVDLQQFAGVNEFKGWPPIVNSGDLDALQLWWRKIGTPTGGVVVVDVASETASNQPGNGLSVSTVKYGRAMKVVAAASGDGLKQTWTFADEPRVKSGHTLSAIVDVWIAQSSATRTVTAKLINNGGTNVTVTQQVVAGWNKIAIEGLALTGTSVDLQITADGAITFYVVPLGCEIDAVRARQLPARPTRYVEKTVTILSGVDLAGATFTATDQTSNTSPLAFKLWIVGDYGNRSSAGNAFYVRRHGDTTAATIALEIARNEVTTSSTYGQGAKPVQCDDGQNIDYQSSGSAANTEDVYMGLFAYEEYA